MIITPRAGERLSSVLKALSWFLKVDKVEQRREKELGKMPEASDPQTAILNSKLLCSDGFQCWNVESYPLTSINRNWGREFSIPGGLSHSVLSRGPQAPFKGVSQNSRLQKGRWWCGFKDKYKNDIITHPWLCPRHISICNTVRLLPHWKTLFH